MLSTLRDYSSYFLWFVVITFVGFMAFSGVQQCGADPAQRGIMAEINGQPITFNAYNAAVTRAMQNRQQPDQELTDEQISQLRDQTWQQLVGSLLLEQETTKRGITVSDEELATFLRQYPPQELQQIEAFRTDGRFDYNKYLDAMQNTDPQLTQFWRSVESAWRPQLRQSKLQQMIISTVRVPEEELLDFYHANNDAARVEFLMVRSNDYNKDVPAPTDSELEALFDAENSRYERDERVKMELAVWTREPSAADEEFAHQQILDVKRQLDEGADFAALAESYGMDGTATVGGDLGWFGAGAMVKPFEDAAFALKMGEISEPVKTQFGWHLIKAEEERKSEADKTKREIRARHILIRPETSQATVDSLYAAASDFAQAVHDENRPLNDSTVSAAGGRFYAPPPVQRQEVVARVGSLPDVKAWAFNAKPGDVSEAIDDGGKFVVARLLEHRPRGKAQFDEVKSLVSTRYYTIEARNLAKVQADSLYREAIAGTALKKLAEAGNVTLTTTGQFTRSTNVANVGKSPLFMGTVFGMTMDDPWSKPVPLESGWAIIHLLELQISDTTQLAAVRDSLSGVVLRQKQNNVFTDWFTDLYENADIKDYRSQATGS
jgi:peptidyl-prolyl cis-trans isomerase D